MTLGTIDLIVKPVFNDATAALAEVTPGTISCSIPYALSVVISSVTRPNIAGSPPFSLITQ